VTARLRWLGHATTVLDLDGVRIMTDPLLGRHAGLLRRRGVAPQDRDWQDPDAVLLSHLHHDHAELSSLRRLGSAPVITAPANAAWLRRRGIESAVGLHENVWFTVGSGTGPGLSASSRRVWGSGPDRDVKEVMVRLTPALHGERPMPHRPNAANGHLICTPSVTIWIAGDTAPYPAMIGLPELAGAPLDVVVVPVGGWGPRLSGGHMDPVQAAEVCHLVGARVAIPVHWGTLHAPASRRLPPGWMDRAGPAFAAAVAHHAPGCRAVVLETGAQVDLTRLLKGSRR
jgi:L-ascorbate metabolism protein UlaG (beta-lactamase superfamily)